MNINIERKVIYFLSCKNCDLQLLIAQKFMFILSLGWILKISFIYGMQEYLEEYVGTDKRRAILYQVQYTK